MGAGCHWRDPSSRVSQGTAGLLQPPRGPLLLQLQPPSALRGPGSLATSAGAWGGDGRRLSRCDPGREGNLLSPVLLGVPAGSRPSCGLAGAGSRRAAAMSGSQAR